MSDLVDILITQYTIGIIYLCGRNSSYLYWFPTNRTQKCTQYRKKTEKSLKWSKFAMSSRDDQVSDLVDILITQYTIGIIYFCERNFSYHYWFRNNRTQKCTQYRKKTEKSLKWSKFAKSSRDDQVSDLVDILIKQYTICIIYLCERNSLYQPWFPNYRILKCTWISLPTSHSFSPMGLRTQFSSMWSTLDLNWAGRVS